MPWGGTLAWTCWEFFPAVIKPLGSKPLLLAARQQHTFHEYPDIIFVIALAVTKAS